MSCVIKFKFRNESDFRYIEVIKEGRLIATAESLVSRGSMKFINET